MWLNQSSLVKVVKEAVYGKDNMEKNLHKDIRDLKNELEELKTKKVMEEREIKHLVKLKEEKLEVENQKKGLDNDKKYQDLVMKLQSDYHNKALGQLESQRKEMKEVHGEILKRLPNITAALEIKKRG